MVEIEVFNELEFFMRCVGVIFLLFDIIVVFGVCFVLLYGVVLDKKIEVGDFVIMDYGCYYDGYCLDMIRIIVVGEFVEKLKEIY